MTETAFRGTLLLLQNRTRRDPEAYRDEFLAQLDHFKALSKTITTQQVTNPHYIAVLNYVCHVGHCFPEECADVVEIILKLLHDSAGGGMAPDLRLALVKSLALLRSKNLVDSERTFPLFFRLLQERDKSLRRLILSHIVSDVRKVNMPGAKNGAQVNKRAQNFLFSVMTEDDSVQARCAEMVMIDLYRRRVWANERTVEVLTQACFSRHTAILRTALRFFILQMPKISSVDDNDDDDEEGDPGRDISKMKQKLKIVKKTGKRERILKRDMNAVKRKYNKADKEEEALARQHVDPVRLLRNPQQFVERLFARLQRTTERFEVRVLFLNVIARVVSEYEVVHLPLYGFLERYMEPSQLHATQLLALSAACVHRMVPPDALEPLVRSIANHFVTDRSTPDAITVGLNTIREICKRQPLAMHEDLLRDLAEYKTQRGDRGVMMAARALIQLYRDVYPELLPPKLRGGRGGPAAAGERPVYGSDRVYTDVPGLELLYAAGENDSDGSGAVSDDDDESGSSGSSGEWVTDSSECDPEDVDGSFVDASDGSEAGECPQLVPAVGEPPAKRMRREEDEALSEVLSLGSGESENNAGEAESEKEEEEEEGEETEDGMDEEVEFDQSEEEEEEEEEEDDEEFDGECEEEDEEKEANENAEWFEDVSTKSTERQSSVRPPSTTTSRVSASAIRILTDEDFERIRRLQAQNGSHRSLRGKGKDREIQARKRHNLVHGISSDLSAHDIEHFTEKKREADREEKIARTQELRQASSKFEARKKKKSKMNSTHTEHSKRGKLFAMTKRSQRVGAKLKSSAADRANRDKDNKKKDIKFRIRRGWKA